MSEHDRRTIRALVPALDDDVDEMTDDEVQKELVDAGVDMKASAAAFKAFAARAVATARRRKLEAAEAALATRTAPRDLFARALELTLNYTDDMIRALIAQKGGMVPAHRERDGSSERELLIQTLADIMALKGEE